MTLQAPRTSVFTFQSAVHSTLILQSLNEQRQQDVLCDVTLVVEDRSFRAHCAILASCSEYFRSKVTGVNRQNPIITLPEEVTVEGFEPLLQFAYTSQLLFTKENINAVQTSARFLGFHNVETACFDFLIPKFSEDKRSSERLRHRPCCQSWQQSANFGSGVDGNHAKSLEFQSSAPLGGEAQTDFALQCGGNTRGQTNGGEERFDLENCESQIAPLSLELAANGVCPMLPLSCPGSDKADQPQFCESDILQMGDACNQSEPTMAGCGFRCELSEPRIVDPSEIAEPASGDNEQTVEILGAQTAFNPASCLLRTSVVEDCAAILEQSEAPPEQSDSSNPASTHKDDRSRVEREVAEHLAKGFWSDLCPSQLPQNSHDPMDQNNLAKASDFLWLKQLDLTSSVGDCPFLRELETGDNPATNTDILSHEEISPCMSSSLNSAEESEMDTDGDTEANNKRAAEIQLPFPVKQILELSRSGFQQLLRDHQLTQEQFEFVHDIRRRSKNRVAAQRCRKRKLDGIQQLECEIKKLISEKDRLLLERTELKQNLEEMQQSLCGLCKSVNIELGSDQNHLFSSPDFPSSSSSSSSSLQEKNKQLQIPPKTVSSSSECGGVEVPSDSAPPAAPQVCTEDPRYPSASLLSACMDTTNGL
ncbi:transcription regulator protein BACH1 isoform X2 [Oryzias latipes]|uniref:BTB and CNC homology 1, basic leucine zipper transcription factor 1 a n=2 Tax=Oryzias latipes TaxID=8090 RepID=A0A3B3HDE5_ORYLA|nr:transcription regulator protein BACH1 isoform X2 [Oryzias latipes]XP_020563774.1 transcription regulator protein BACH1 isoform X2 [Oryzias latipes]